MPPKILRARCHTAALATAKEIADSSAGTECGHDACRPIIRDVPVSDGRLTYRVDDGLLVLTAVGSPTYLQRRATFEAVRADPDVPERAPLLFDTRALTEILTSTEGQQRLSELVTGLGLKMGHVCANLASGRNPVATHFFQVTAGAHGVRVGLFDDEVAARRWLAATGRG
jgi:hypothetical protein